MSSGKVATPSRLIALETAEQVAAWQRMGALIEGAKIVALSAEADDALDCLGVAHSSIEEFYAEIALMAQAADNNAAVERLCAAIDELLDIHIAGKLPVFSAYYHRGRLRMLYDALQRGGFCVGAMLDALAPSEVVGGEVEPSDTSEILIRDTTFLSRVLADLCRQRGIAFNPLPKDAVEAPAEVPLAKRAVGKLRRLRDRLRTVVPAAGDIAFFFWPDRPDTELRRLQLKTVSLPAALSEVSAARSMPLSTLEDHFVFGRNNLFAVARPALASFLGKFRSRSIAQLHATERVLARSGAKACVATAPVNIEAINAMLAARRAGIPAIVLQHGGFNGYAEYSILPFTDFGLNDVYLCYGPGVADGLAPMARALSPVRDRAIASVPVGSPSVHAIYRNRSPRPAGKRRRVIYVPAILTGSVRYLAGHVRSDISYWRQQRRVLELLMSRPEWEVTFRPPPPNFVPNPILPWLGRHAGHQVRIHTGGTFGALLIEEHFDLIVTDAVTTVMLEALATNARIVTQFEGTVMKLRPEAEALLRRRAAVSFSEAEFLSDIASALDGTSSAAPVEDSFLLEYALAGRDENPADLQAAAIKTIIESHSGLIHAA